MSKWKRVRILVLASAWMMTSACAVTLISRYDEVFDASATSLQHQLDTYLTRLEQLPVPSDSAKYVVNAPFYTSYEIDLRALLIRARSLPKNTETAEQVELLITSVEDLRQQHQRRDQLDPGYLGVELTSLNQQWQAILALELAKKR